MLTHHDTLLERPAPLDLRRRGAAPLIAGLAASAALLGCTPTVKVEAPREPITINLNVRVDAEVLVKLEEQAEKDIAAQPNIF